MTYRPVSSLVGVAESELGTVSGQTPLRMMASATLDALAEAGLTLADVDGLFTAGLPSWSPALELADYLGIHLRYLDSTTSAAARSSSRSRRPTRPDVHLPRHLRAPDRAARARHRPLRPGHRPLHARVRDHERAGGRGRGRLAVLGGDKPQGLPLRQAADHRGRAGVAAFPLNTSGGGMSYCHPGRFGIFLLIEAVRQLRGECGERQVAGAEVALAHGTGGNLSSSATVIMRKGSVDE